MQVQVINFEIVVTVLISPCTDTNFIVLVQIRIPYPQKVRYLNDLLTNNGMTWYANLHFLPAIVHKDKMDLFRIGNVPKQTNFP